MKLKDKLFHPLGNFLALGFGSGLSKVAPGTMGTLAAIPFYLLLFQFLPTIVYFIALVLLTILGIKICDVASKSLGVPDHPAIVFDEMVGYWLGMMFAPAGWFWVLLGFGFFRLFDIAKPWPIRKLDRQVHGGLGIMVDDILAGVYTIMSLKVLEWALF